MKPFSLLALVSVLLMFPATTYAEPYSVSCGLAIEKLSKARKALVPYQRAMELARIHERVVLTESVVMCAPGGVYSVQRAQRCNQSTFEAPQRVKETLEAEDAYLQGRRTFQERLAWVEKICLLEP